MRRQALGGYIMPRAGTSPARETETGRHWQGENTHLFLPHLLHFFSYFPVFIPPTPLHHLEPRLDPPGASSRREQEMLQVMGPGPIEQDVVSPRTQQAMNDRGLDRPVPEDQICGRWLLKRKCAWHLCLCV